MCFLFPLGNAKGCEYGSFIKFHSPMHTIDIVWHWPFARPSPLTRRFTGPTWGLSRAPWTLLFGSAAFQSDSILFWSNSVLQHFENILDVHFDKSFLYFRHWEFLPKIKPPHTNDVTRKRLLNYCPFVNRIHRWLVDFPQWGPLMWSFVLFVVLLNKSNRQVAGDFKWTPLWSCDVTIMRRSETG